MTFNPDCSKQAQEIIITTIIELNNLDPSLRNSKSITVFKSELLCWMTWQFLNALELLSP